MATVNKTMKTFNVPSGSDTICYEIFDDNGRKCIAKDWYANSTSKFNAGEYVIKDGVCYKFKVDHAANTSWSASEVVATNLGSELSDVKSALDTFKNRIEILVPQSWTWEQGGYSATTGTGVSSNKQIKTGLPDGIGKLTSVNGVVLRLWAYDSSNNFVGHWNGTSFVKTSSVDNFTVLDFSNIPNNNYRYRITALNNDGTDITPTSAQYVYVVETTDKSLSIDGKSADAKATGEKIQTEKNNIINTENEVFNSIGKTLNFIYPRFINGYYDITAVGTTIDLSDLQASDSIYTAVIELTEGYQLKISGIVGGGSSSGGARAYAFLDENNTVLDRASINVTLTSTPVIPSGSKYIILNSTTMDDVTVYLTTGFFDSLKYNYRQNTIVVYDFGVYDEKNATITAAEKWATGSNYTSVMVPVPRGYDKKITVVANQSRETMVSCLTSDIVGSNGQTVQTFADGETERHVITANTTQSFVTGANCNYLFVVKISSGNDYTPTSIVIELMENIDSSDITEIKEDINEIKLNPTFAGSSEGILTRVIALNANGHDMPQNRGVLNAYKKAHEMKDIVWTALSAIPGSGSETAIIAGEHTGLPYSSVKEYDKFIGWEVSFITFMSAAHNPYSLLYTEDTLASRSRSDYGITYHGTNCGSYFGIVCNIFVLYALGFKIPWNTAEFAYLNKIGKLGKPYDQSATGMRLMDIVWEPGHANIILDIERNEYGEPVYIWWAESVSYFPVINKYTPQAVNDRLVERGGVIYYSNDLYKNLEYNPIWLDSTHLANPYILDEHGNPTPYTYNDDLCTYAGDYACFNSSDEVWINYTAGSYTQIELYKNETLISTTSISSSAHKIKLTTSGYGKYKARLKNGSNYSDFTYFEIVDTTVSCTYVSGVLMVNFSSANGTPLYAQLTYRNGHSRGIIELTDNDINDGMVQFKPDDVLAEQYPGETFETNVYIKVFFKGDYGVVPNAYLDTGIVT